MTDKPTDATDTSLTEPVPESERQEASEQETSEAPQQFIEQSRIEQVIASAIGPARDPVLEKVTEGHITKVIELTGEDSKADRRYKMAYILIGIISFFALTFYMMPVDKELYKQVIQLLVAAGGGFGAGYGYRRLQE